MMFKVRVNSKDKSMELLFLKKAVMQLYLLKLNVTLGHHLITLHSA